MKKIVLMVLGLVVLAGVAGVLFVAVRQALAAAQAERRWQAAQVAPLGDFGATRSLEILPLYDEAGDAGRYQVGHGLAYLIKTDTQTLLLDIGNNPAEADRLPLLANMQALGISWEQIDGLVFSHFHPDHVGGVAAWKAGRVSFAGQRIDWPGRPVYAPSRFEFAGAVPTLLPDPAVLGPGVATSGAIEYGETYPVSLYAASGVEQVLAINVEGQGIVLVMGCGHPTVERIVARAEALFAAPVVGIVGGFHYEGKRAEEVQPQIEFLQARPLRLVAPSPHDSSAEALQAFQAAFAPVYQPVMVGQAIRMGSR